MGHAPNGDRYYFDTMPEGLLLPDLYESTADGDQKRFLERQEIRIYASKIEDRFGNYVTGLTASDGRAVTKTVSGDTTIYSYGGRQWTVKSSNPYTVTYPDGSTWVANVSGSLYSTTGSKSSCPGNPTYSISPLQAVATVKSRAGATAVYTVKQQLLGYSYVSGACDQDGLGSTTRPSRMVYPTLVSRTLSGPGLPASTVTVTYGSTNDCFSDSVYWSPKCSASSPTTRIVTYSYSDGHYQKYTFGNRYLVDADLLLQLEEGQGSSAPIKTTVYQYSLQNGVGFIVGDYPYGAGEYKRAVLISRVITQDGRTFSWSVPSTCGSGTSLCIDQYGRPTKVIKSSAPSP